ncbi:MAG: GNAT family N-acetyltransferase, partial [Povalibacter sp.]
MYSIRQATERDLAVLPEIEDAAGTLFLDTSYAALASQPNTSANIDPARDHVWVIAHGHVPVGFLMARDIAGAVHVQELHIHPRFAHRRLGAQLIEHVAHWARAKNSPALTLTTFA